jgi:uncharacterized repeat protein (TIGR03803 family)
VKETIMMNPPTHSTSILRSNPRTKFALMLLCALTSVALPPAQAQTFSVIHNFSGGQDGATPYAGLTMDKAGNFYGTTFAGGSRALGTVYRLKRSGSNWVADGLYSFLGGVSDGSEPLARVIFGPDGSLYGTASLGGPGQCSLGCGAVFNLRPPATVCRSVTCPWTETILHFFGPYPDGFFPTGELIFDEAGNLYGTTELGGVEAGIVYELTRSGNAWTETIIHNFSGRDGYEPYGGLISDNAGNLYGTTQDGGLNYAGTVFRLTDSGSGWTESLPHIFQLADGGYPAAGLVFDQSGNLYGATTYGGSDGAGVVFELSPSGASWTYSVLYSFTGGDGCPYDEYIGSGPWAPLTMDAAGNLHGTTRCDGANRMGNIFKLTPSSGGWTYTALHDFSGGDDGAYPLSNVIMAASGNLYGTASAGGSQGHGVVWEITP